MSGEEELRLLFEACTEGREEVVSAMIEAQVDVNTCNEKGFTPLMIALQHGHDRCVRALMGALGVDVNVKNKNGITATIISAEYGRVEALVALIGVPGIDINTQNNDGWSALMFASFKGYAACVEALIGAPGVDVNRRDNRGGFSALMIASSLGRTETVGVLLKATGVDVNAQSLDGATPISLASKFARVEIVRLLLDAKADPRIADDDGTTTLHYIAEYRGTESVARQCELIRLLVEREDGAKLDAVDKNGLRPLQLARAGSEVRALLTEMELTGADEGFKLVKSAEKRARLGPE